MKHNDQPEAQCCGQDGISRRTVLKTATVVGSAFTVTQMFGEAMMQATYAGVPGGNTLVVISLRGGVDGLGVVVPHGDASYYQARPTTAVPASALVCADPMFGLHPALKPLEPLWTAGGLAAIQATGLPAPNRSHFAAIEAVEDAAPGSSTRIGWVNRMVGLGSTPSTLDAIQMGLDYPTSALQGSNKVLAARRLTALQLPLVGTSAAQRYRSMATAWSSSPSVLAAGAIEAISVSKNVGRKLAAMPSSPTVYPTSPFAQPFAQPLENAAKVIRADLGTDVIAIDAGNWDMHTGYGTLQGGRMQSGLAGLAQSLAAFISDLGNHRSRVTVITISEFGRRVAENGSQGFDHGWGNMMLVAGAGVKGGKYYGTWPGLAQGSLTDGDLKVTTDYRAVLAEVVASRFPDRSVVDLFPGFTPAPLGFMTA